MIMVIYKNFLGYVLDWYKKIIIGFLIVNFLLFMFDLYFVGWVLIIEFIFIFVMVLKCYLL